MKLIYFELSGLPSTLTFRSGVVMFGIDQATPNSGTCGKPQDELSRCANESLAMDTSVEFWSRHH
jgi:hypothetical protein